MTRQPCVRQLFGRIGREIGLAREKWLHTDMSKNTGARGPAAPILRACPNPMLL